ncbi:YdeI/OmpD-associated family protein [Jiulongibacter sp. NS-SX5]|uniref:YdeI/OmpD-associated family protein n=1 Tax=Jiulongibacter sp. NS-SX5 TaxID=3463854 RepID=UPI00405990BD
MKEPILDLVLTIQKFPGKGGWHFVDLEDILPDSSNPFGWREVDVLFDHLELTHYKLMPKGDGKLFLPIKAEIRRKLKKAEGDRLRIRIYECQTSWQTPHEILECIIDIPEAFAFYSSLKPSHQKQYIDWINAAKSMDTKVQRINEMTEKLRRKKKFHDS